MAGIGFVLLGALGASVFAFYSVQKRACVRLLDFEETTGSLTKADNVGSVIRPMPAVRYNYSVGGVRYESDRYSYSKYQRYYPPVAWLAVYGDKQGATVPVFYDPRQPSFAVLDYMGRGKVEVKKADCEINMLFGGVLLALAMLGVGYVFLMPSRE